MLYTMVQEETAIHAGFPELLDKPEAPAFFTYTLFQMDQYGNATLTRFVGVMLHLEMMSWAIFLHVNFRFLIMCQSLNLTFPHLIPCQNMDFITQEDLNETEDLHFATDNLDTITFFPIIYFTEEVLCDIMCVIILCWKHRFAPCMPCLLKLCKPCKCTCFWRNATSKVITGPDYAITIRMALYIKQVSGHFHSFHYVLVILMYRCELKLNLVWKVVIIYIFKNTTLNHATIHIGKRKFLKFSDDMSIERNILLLKMIQDHIDLLPFL